MPHELSFLGVYFSPLILSCLLGFGLAALTSAGLARLGWFRFFANPHWVVAALGVIAVCLLSMTLIPI